MLVETTSAVLGRRYRLQDRLGAGGMGAVYRAYDRLTGEWIALKRVLAADEDIVFTSSHRSVDLRVALAQEFQWLASLRHPYIIAVLDYGFDSERQPYFTMELLNGAQTIREAARSIPRDEQLALFVQVLQALTYLHRRGIIHRDIKPGNVLVTNNQARVLDFGLSVRMSTESAESSGTLAYMAPELLMGEPATISSDLYALGIIAYEVFAGQHPFDVKSLTILTEQILREPPDLSLLNLDPLL